MRLLIAMPERATAMRVRECLYAGDENWAASVADNGQDALCMLYGGGYDLLLLHFCLPVFGGAEVLRELNQRPMLCPPRVLYLCERELCSDTSGADYIAPVCAAPDKLAGLVCALAKKPLPSLAAAQAGTVSLTVRAFLDALSMRRELKGCALIAWILERIIPSPPLERTPVSEWYADCARAFGVTPAAVERCVRVAVESVFTQGSIGGIERYFGATVDPERGKPTNRAFLLQAAQQLRLSMSRDLSDYSLTAERAGNSSDMHQSPAAPTRV